MVIWKKHIDTANGKEKARLYALLKQKKEVWNAAMAGQGGESWKRRRTRQDETRTKFPQDVDYKYMDAPSNTT